MARLRKSSALYIFFVLCLTLAIAAFGQSSRSRGASEHTSSVQADGDEDRESDRDADQNEGSQLEERLERKEDPRSRERWFLRGRTVQGRIATRELEHAVQQKQAMRRAMRTGNEASSRVMATTNSDAANTSGTITQFAVSGFPSTGGSWTPFGPAPLRSTTTPNVDQDYGYVSGRATTVVVDPNDATGNTVYLAGAYGGLWRSTTAANPDVTKVLWTPLIDNQATLAVGAIAIQPGNNKLILAGTGETNSSMDSYYGLGILRSTDGGSTWTLINSASGGTLSLHGLGFSQIAYSTDNPTVVVAAAAGASEGILVGAESPNFNAKRGLYYSIDSGATWSYANVTDIGGPAPDAVSVTAVIYNAVRHKFYAAYRYHGFYSSPDGITWTRLPNQPPAATGRSLSLANCPTSPTNGSTCPLYRGEIAQVPGRDEMYVWYVDASTPEPVNQGIYQTTDGGATWKAISTAGIDNCGDSLGCGTDQGDYNLALTAVPNGTTTDLYAGAVNLYKCNLNSADPTCAVTSFTNLTHVYGCTPVGSVSHVHPDQHGIDFARGNPALMFFANDGGIYRSLQSFNSQAEQCSQPSNGNPVMVNTLAFDNLNGNLGSLTEFVWFDQHPTQEYTLLGGTQDNGSPAVDIDHAGVNGLTWMEVNSGDGGYTAINPSNPNEWFTSNPGVNIQRCGNGINCTEADFTAGQVITSATLGGDSSSFFMPFLLDPQNTSQLILGTCRVWRAGTNGSSPQAISNNFDGTLGSCSGLSTAFVSALAAGGPSTTNGSQVIYVGTEDGRVWVTQSADAGVGAWGDRSPVAGGFQSPGCGSPGQCPYPVGGIVIDSRDVSGATAYATVTGFKIGHVWQTTNSGLSWADISGNLPDVPTNTVIVDGYSGRVYVGTDIGVFSALPAGANTTWSEVGVTSGTGTLPTVVVTRLAIFNPPGQPPRLRASTYGRGVWEIALPGSTAPDYSLALASPTIVTYPGISGNISGTLTASNGFAAPVTVTCDAGATPPSGSLPQTCLSVSSVTPSASGSAFSLATSNPTPADFAFRVRATDASGNIIRQQPVSVRVIDFALGTPNPSTESVIHGNNATVQMEVDSLGSFDRSVSFACGAAPVGITCSGAPVTLSPGGSQAASVSIATDSGLPAGTYTVQITATSSDSLRTHAQNVSLTVAVAPDFSVSGGLSTPGTIKIGQPLAGSLTITAHDGYSGTVTLACSAAVGAVSGACVVTPSSVNIGTSAGSANVSVTTSGLAAGTGQISVTAMGATSHSMQLPFAVIDFGVGSVSAPASTAPGGVTKFSVMLTPLNGYGQSVNVSCDTSSLGAQTCILSPASPITLTPGSSTLVSASVSVPSSVQSGSYPVSVAVTDAAYPSLSHSVSAAVQVSPTPDFTTTVSPSSAAVKAGVSAQTTVNLSFSGGFQGQVTLSCAGLPSLATCSFGRAGSSGTVTVQSGSSSSVSLTIATTAPTVAALNQGWAIRTWLFAMLYFPIGLAFVGLPITQWARRILALILILAVAALVSCGGGSSGGSSTSTAPPQPKAGTPAGQYTVVVTAMSGNIIHTQNFTLTVQ